jgi:hypothetical protein
VLGRACFQALRVDSEWNVWAIGEVANARTWRQLPYNISTGRDCFVPVNCATCAVTMRNPLAPAQTVRAKQSSSLRRCGQLFDGSAKS